MLQNTSQLSTNFRLKERNNKMKDVAQTQDVTVTFKQWCANVLKAERKGCNTLILRRCEHLTRACDGRARRFCVEYRWHASETSDLNSVQGNEFTYFGYREVSGWKKKSLFELFQLF